MVLLHPGDGLAMVLGAFMLCLLVVPAVVLAVIAWRLTRDAAPGVRLASMLGAALLGPVLGVVTIKLSLDLPWSYFAGWVIEPEPPPELLIEVPPDREHDWLVVIEDPGAERAV